MDALIGDSESRRGCLHQPGDSTAGHEVTGGHQCRSVSEALMTFTDDMLDRRSVEAGWVAVFPVRRDTTAVVKVVMCRRGGGSASEVETHKNIDSVLHTKTTFQAHSIFSVSIQK